MQANEKEVNVKRLPKVGETVLVTYTTDGEGKIIGKGKPEPTAIRRVYLDGTIGVGSGDVYSIVPATTGNAPWMTAKPKKHFIQ